MEMVLPKKLCGKKSGVFECRELLQKEGCAPSRTGKIWVSGNVRSEQESKKKEMKKKMSIRGVNKQKLWTSNNVSCAPCTPHAALPRSLHMCPGLSLHLMETIKSYEMRLYRKEEEETFAGTL